MPDRLQDYLGGVALVKPKRVHKISGLVPFHFDYWPDVYIDGLLCHEDSWYIFWKKMGERQVAPMELVGIKYLTLDIVLANSRMLDSSMFYVDWNWSKTESHLRITPRPFEGEDVGDTVILEFRCREVYQCE